MATRQNDDDKPVIYSIDALRALLSQAASHTSVEIALLHIMKTFNFRVSLLQQIMDEYHINFSFANVHYKNIAPLVGLDPNCNMYDIKTFELHRSRIPTTIFKSIVQNIDLMQVQYGPPIDHPTEMARSQFLSPIFNHLIALFGSALRNLPESTTESVKYYIKMIGPIPLLFIVAGFNLPERLDAIAQVIAECNACDWKNMQQDFQVPVYGILYNGDVFEFFLFDGTTNPYSFKYGLRPNDSPNLRRTFRLPHPADTPTPRPFLDALRPICEVIFDLLLNSYVSSLMAHTVKRSTEEHQPQENLDKWKEAISAGVKALEVFRDAETKRQTQLTDAANSLAEEAMASLKHSVDAIPILHKPALCMSGWDNEGIEKV